MEPHCKSWLLTVIFLLLPKLSKMSLDTALLFGYTYTLTSASKHDRVTGTRFNLPTEEQQQRQNI